MLRDLTNHEFFNFFEENRLVFIKPRGSKETPISKTRKSPKQMREELAAQIERLDSDDPFAIGDDKPGLTTHTDTRIHTREATPQKPYYKESVQIAERAVMLSGRREAKETLLIQGVHNNLYTQYMNPGFMMHLNAQPGNLVEKIYPVLDLIMKYPDDFEYISKGGQILHIVKKRPFKDRPAAIKDDFLVIMEGGAGHISRVRHNVSHGGFDKDLKEGGKIPWVTNDRFSKNLPLYNKMWNSAHARYLYAGGYQKWLAEGRPAGGWDKLFKESFVDIDKNEKELVEIHVAMNILFPQRFVDLVASRGLKFEQKDKRVRQIIRQQVKQGKTYEDITKRGYGADGQFRISVLADPKVPGVYQIYTKKYSRNPLRVNLQGQIMRQGEDGLWLPDARYTDNVRRDYYYREDNGKNKDLLTADNELTAEDKKRMEDAEKETKPDSETTKRVAAMFDLIEKREKVDVALYKEQDPEKLGQIAIYLLPPKKKANPYYTSFIYKMVELAKADYRAKAKIMRQFQDGAKTTLDTKDVPKLIHTRNNYIAGILGVTF